MPRIRHHVMQHRMSTHCIMRASFLAQHAAHPNCKSPRTQLSCSNRCGIKGQETSFRNRIGNNFPCPNGLQSRVPKEPLSALESGTTFRAQMSYKVSLPRNNFPCSNLARKYVPIRGFALTAQISDKDASSPTEPKSVLILSTETCPRTEHGKRFIGCWI